MAGYGTEQQAMARGAQAVETAATAITQQLRTLDSSVETMFSGWNSAAQRSFAGLHAAWAEQQLKLNTALEQMHAALVQTSQAYATQEDQQSAAFGKITNEL